MKDLKNTGIDEKKKKKKKTSYRTTGEDTESNMEEKTEKMGDSTG